MGSKQRLIIFLVAAVIPLVNYLIALLIVLNLINRYMFTAYINAIVTFSLLTPISESFSFRSDDWAIVKYLGNTKEKRAIFKPKCALKKLTIVT